MKPTRSNKSYQPLDGPPQRNPEDLAVLVTTDADFGVVEVITRDDNFTTVAVRESGRGKPKWVNVRVRNAAIKYFRPLGTQGGSQMKALSVPSWITAKLVHISRGPR
jgi:hypothetical protein